MDNEKNENEEMEEKQNNAEWKQQQLKWEQERQDKIEKERQQLEDLEQQRINTQTNQDNEAQEEQMRNPEQKQSVKRSSYWKSFLGMLAAAILGSVLTLGAVTQTDWFQSDNQSNGASIPTQTETDSNGSADATPVVSTGSVADVVDSASDAIVGIVNMSEQDNPFFNTESEVKKGVGSGVIYKVDDDGAYIVTNNHVVENASSLKVYLANGDTVDGEIVGADPLTDMAVVKIKGDYDIKPIEFGDSDSLRAGDQVIAIGNPLGLELSRTVTKGIVSAVDRTIPVQTSAGEWEFDVIQTDAAINHGNSGGALLNTDGQLVGINSLKVGGNGVEGLGFAIPSNQVKQLVNEIADNGKVLRPYVGVGIKGVNEIPSYYLQSLPSDVREGVVVLSVDDQSAAAKAGIEVEDVIVGINGERISDSKDFRTYLYKELSAGDKATFDVYHDGELKQVELTLTSNSDIK